MKEKLQLKDEEKVGGQNKRTLDFFRDFSLNLGGK